MSQENHPPASEPLAESPSGSQGQSSPFLTGATSASNSSSAGGGEARLSPKPTSNSPGTSFHGGQVCRFVLYNILASYRVYF